MAGLSKRELIEELRERDAVIERLLAALERERSENALLRQKVDRLVRRVFGSSSEKLEPGQLDLFLSGVEDAPGKADASWNQEADRAPSHPRAPRGRERCPADLPVVEEVIDPDEVKSSPSQWRCIGEEVNEQLDYQPARFFRRRLVRRKYVSRGQTDLAPVIAPLPDMLQERGSAAPGLLAQVIVAKFCDHLPLYRQEQIYWTRHRVWLPRQTLVRWMELAADWLRPIYECIRAEVTAGGYVQVDETPIRYLSPGHGQTKLGYFWAASRPGGDVVYQWHTSRAARCLEKVLPAAFTGTVQCDGYAAYGSHARDRATIRLAACWAHARRKVYDAREQDPRVAAWLLRQIGHLYRIERKLRAARSGPHLRAAVRSSEARVLYQRIHRALSRLKLTRRYLPRSGMGQAIDYTLAQWPLLGVYLDDGRIEIDNNSIENSIRPTAVGKRNWLFIGGADTGQRSAILFTIVESCRRRGIDPHAYLSDVLARLPSSTNWQVKGLTPEAWSKGTETVALPHAA